MSKVKEKKSLQQIFEEAVVPPAKSPYTLPPNWCFIFFMSIAEFGMGQTVLSKELREAGIPIYSATAEDKIFGYIGKEDNKIKLSYGDFVIAARGTIGSVKLIKEESACCTQTTMYMKPYDKSISKYIYYVMEYFSDEIFRSSGATIPQLTITSLKDKIIPLAPIDEQNRIVEKIENLFARLDEARDLVQKCLDSFEDRKSAILHKAFTGELTKDWRKNKGINYGYRIEFLKNLLYPLVTKKPNKNDEYLYYIDIDSIDNHLQKVRSPKKILVKEAPSRAAREVRENDVLFSMVRPYLKNIALITNDISECIASTGFYVCRCKEGLYPRFLFYFLINREVLDYLTFNFMRGDNSPSIRKSDLLGLSIKLPPIEEQKEIVRILDNFFEKEDKTNELLDLSDKIEEMKKVILAKAFRGQLGTNNPNDEPATELLKSILKEKFKE